MNGFKTTTVDTASQAIAETGKQAVQDFINIYTDPQMPGPTIPDTTIIPPVPYRPTPELAALPVGILGAGVSGLYTAMILDSLYVWNILRHLYHPQRLFLQGYQVRNHGILRSNWGTTFYSQLLQKSRTISILRSSISFQYFCLISLILIFPLPPR